MFRLFEFFRTYYTFIVFLFLEFFCVFLLITNNSYTRLAFFNSSQYLAGSLLLITDHAYSYLALREKNTELAHENTWLRNQLIQLRHNHLSSTALDTPYIRSDVKMRFISAKVIHSSTQNYKNFITINQGVLSGVEPGMAVVGGLGIVGKIKYVSDHFSVVMPLLNMDQQVSASLLRTGHIGSVQWDGRNPLIVNLHYIPRHVSPQVEDTVVTSGYNAVFPEHLIIGTIHSVNLRKESVFYDIQVHLAQDFTNLAYVHVVQSAFRKELDSLQNKVIKK